MPIPVRQRVKHAVKVAIAHVLYGCGLLQLWQRYRMRRRAVVLMYHRVLTDAEWRATGSHPAMSVTTTTFERHMALLRRKFVPLSLEAFTEHLEQRRPFPSSSCLITFDDGWRDTMTNAVPVMRRHHLPVAIFLPVNFVGSRRLFAREAFAHLVMHARQRVRRQPGSAARIRALLGTHGLASLLDLPDEGARAAVIASIGAAPVDASIDALVAELARELDVTTADLDTPDGFMTWSDVKATAGNGVSFGGHGADHLQLARLSPDQADEEVRRSREALDEHAKPPVWAFSYPNGSCDASVAAIVRSHGYQLGFTTHGGLVGCEDDPFLLRRVNIQEAATSSTPMFMARLAGLF